MGFIESLKRWLFPRKSPEDLMVELETFSELLDLNRMEIESKVEDVEKRILKYLRLGNREQAKHYVKLKLQYMAQAAALDQYKSTIDSIHAQMSQARLMDKSFKLIEDIVATVKGIVVSFPSVPKISKKAEEINKLLESIYKTNEVVLNNIQPKTIGLNVDEDKVEEELSKLEKVVKTEVEEVEVKEELPEPLEEEISKSKEKLKRLEEV
ncbi:MAG: Snf7 family protein [Candidatus Asgardarchaeia archaeon]